MSENMPFEWLNILNSLELAAKPGDISEIKYNFYPVFFCEYTKIDLGVEM